jgi:hypothetical protein
MALQFGGIRIHLAPARLTFNVIGWKGGRKAMTMSYPRPGVVVPSEDLTNRTKALHREFFTDVDAAVFD